MAKDNYQRYDPAAEVRELAARLFAAQWGPQRGQTPEALAARCFQGAQVFYRVASRIREGQSPDDILGAPDNVTVTPSI